MVKLLDACIDSVKAGFTFMAEISPDVISFVHEYAYIWANVQKIDLFS